jgi:hypothetical protein
MKFRLLLSDINTHLLEITKILFLVFITFLVLIL